MKAFLKALTLFIITSYSYAQTPFDSFVKSDKKKEMLGDKPVVFRAENSDTTGKIKFVELNLNDMTLVYYDRLNTIIRAVDVKPTDFKWLSVDPLASKYPHETPYNYVGNNPLLYIDPDGAEKIVVSGGADLHNKNRMNFATAAKNQILQYKQQVARAGSKEQITWMIMDKDYTAAEKKAFSKWAKKQGIGQPIYVSSADEIINYANSKSTTNSALTTDRTQDGITNFSIMSHGVPSAVALGYENTGWTAKRSDPSVMDNNDINNINGAAFMCGSQINLYTCNSATPNNMEAQDYSTQTELVNDAMTGDNLVKSFSNKAKGATVTGFIGQTSYSGVGNGSLPTGATMDGSYSPTVNGQHPPTIQVQMQNGQIKH